MRAGFGCSLQGLKVHMHLLNSAAIQTLLRRDERQCACGLIVREHSGHRMVRVAAPRLHFGQQVFVQTRSAARALGRWGAAMAMRSGIACGGSVASVRHSWIAGATRSASTLLDHTGEDSRPPRVPPARGPPLWDEFDLALAVREDTRADAHRSTTTRAAFG